MSFSSSDDGMTTSTRFAPAEEIELYCPACDQSYHDELVHCPNDGSRLVRLNEVKDPLLGRNLEGRFLIKERLGVGGMGAVYRAWQGSVGREVAVKVIESRLKGGRLAAKRFLREAKLASRLSHANTVAVIDFGQTDDGLLYLVMELVRGRTLTDVMLEDGPFSVERMVRLGLQLTDALQAAHGISIIHRDLKPSNIIVLDEPAGRDNIKVLDFGLAKSLVDHGETTVTQSDAIMGTPSYIPPEAVTRMHFDERSDLYSMGVILYEVLAGRLPFDASTVQAMLRQHAFEMPAPLPEHIPPVASDLLFRLLEKDPERRPQTAQEVRDGLLALVGVPEGATPLPMSRPHGGIGSVAGGFPTPNTATRGPAAPHSQPGIDQTIAIKPSRRPWVIIATMGIALSLAAVLLASGVFDSSAGTPSPVANDAPPTRQIPVEPTASLASASDTEASSLPASINLDLTSEPNGAIAYIDGERLGEAPGTYPVPRGDVAIDIEFKADGYKPELVKVIPNSDQPVAVELEQIASTDRAGKSKATRGSRGNRTGRGARTGKNTRTGKTTGGKSTKTGSSGNTDSGGETDKPPPRWVSPK